jgi:hypothetical protein
VGCRISIVPILAVAAALAAAPAAAQDHGAPQQSPSGQPGPILSPRDTTRFSLGGGREVMVDYGRPFARGRRIMGGLVPFGRVWRTGANAATTMVTGSDLVIGGASVPRGTYTLYTIPTATGWTLIVNRQTGQWGTEYDASRDLVRIPMRATALRQPVEQFTISVERGTGGTNTLAFAWERTRATVPFRVASPARAGR